MSLPKLSRVDARRAARFLRRGYELERAGYRGSINALEIGRLLGFEDYQSQDICGYLAGKGFIEWLGPRYSFRLSLKGHNEVEWGLANPGFLHDLLCEEAPELAWR
jgi:hypothetical protein